MPLFIVDDKYWCGSDVYYGHDIVIDIVSQKSYTSNEGVFDRDFVFLGSYYGYDNGAFYYRTL